MFDFIIVIDGVNYRSFDNLDELNEVIDTAYEEVELVKSIQVEGEGVWLKCKKFIRLFLFI